MGYCIISYSETSMYKLNRNNMQQLHFCVSFKYSFRISKMAIIQQIPRFLFGTRKHTDVLFFQSGSSLYLNWCEYRRSASYKFSDLSRVHSISPCSTCRFYRVLCMLQHRKSHDLRIISQQCTSVHSTFLNAKDTSPR